MRAIVVISMQIIEDINKYNSQVRKIGRTHSQMQQQLNQELSGIRIWSHSNHENIHKFQRCNHKGRDQSSHDRTRCHILLVHQGLRDIQLFCFMVVWVYGKSKTLKYEAANDKSKGATQKDENDLFSNWDTDIDSRYQGLSDFAANVWLT